MQVRERRRSGEATAHTTDAGRTQVAPGGRWPRWLVTTAAVACVTLLIAVAIISSTGGSGFGGSAQPSVVAPASVATADQISATGLQEAGTWIEGLAAGMILPSDVTSRLAAQDPRTARIVMAAWSDLSGAISADSSKAASWLVGLADGVIRPSDVTSRLAVQDPRTARIVMAAWSDLNPRRPDRSEDASVRNAGRPEEGLLAHRPHVATGGTVAGPQVGWPAPSVERRAAKVDSDDGRIQGG